MYTIMESTTVRCLILADLTTFQDLDTFGVAKITAVMLKCHQELPEEVTSPVEDNSPLHQACQTVGSPKKSSAYSRAFRIFSLHRWDV